MKIIAIPVIILFLNFCTYLCHVNKIFNNSSSPCESPLKCPPLNETKPQVHPYHNVNLSRDLSPVNLFETDIGNKSLYKIKKELGTGAFGSVFTAIHTPTGDEVALKLFLRNKEEKISKEALILQELKDAPNFLPLRDMFKEKDGNGDVTIGLVVEYFEADKFRNIYQTLDAYQVKVMIFKTMKTLEYAHSKGIMHRDIKPFNVLMDPEALQVRVIDWGQADYYVPNKSFTPRVSTIAYMAPELLLGYDKYDYSLDVWNTGIMLLEMTFKKFHFFEQNRTKFPVYQHQTTKEQEMVLRRAQLDQYAQVFGTEELRRFAIKFKYDMEYVSLLRYVGRYEGVPLTNFITEANADMIDPLVLDLLSKMLVYDHTKRITMTEALEHPYFNEVREKYGSE